MLSAKQLLLDLTFFICSPLDSRPGTPTYDSYLWTDYDTTATTIDVRHALLQPSNRPFEWFWWAEHSSETLRELTPDFMMHCYCNVDLAGVVWYRESNLKENAAILGGQTDKQAFNLNTIFLLYDHHSAFAAAGCCWVIRSVSSTLAAQNELSRFVEVFDDNEISRWAPLARCQLARWLQAVAAHRSISCEHSRSESEVINSRPTFSPHIHLTPN